MPECSPCDSAAFLPRLGATGLKVPSTVCAGTLPASWANNTSLRTLNLSDNNFTGSLPQQWAALSQLQTLNASRNTLSGTIPSSWSNGSMHSLTAL